MKKIFIACASILVISSVSSCKKCYTCDFGNGRTEKYCPKDFPEGNSDLKLTIQAYEDRGYKCVQD